MSAKTERQIIRKGGYMRGHSLNQEIMRANSQGGERMSREPNKNQARSERGKARGEIQGALDFMPELRIVQFNRALRHVLSGAATPEEVRYYIKHESQFGRQIDDQVIIVDIVSSNGKL